jgi:DnaJ-domain-containing protein 1
MSLRDLGKKIFQAAQKHGQILWDEMGKDLDNPDRWWEKVKSEFRVQGNLFLKDLGEEMRAWLIEEGRRQGVSWSNLIGRDPRVEEAYRLLELPYGTPMDDVKHRFRDLLKLHHPDRFMADPNQYKLATRTSQSFTEAYHQIQKAFDEGRI